MDGSYLDNKGEPQRNCASLHYHPFDSEEAARESLLKYWETQLAEKYKDTKVWDVKFEVTLIGRYRWWLTWFAHETNQRFKSQQEAFADFEKFCDEHRFWAWEDRWDGTEKGFIWCPMGANDRYRWKVCECEKCKQEGIHRIIH